MSKSYHPDVPYYEHNPALPVLEVRKGDVISFRGYIGDTVIEYFGIVTKATHDVDGEIVELEFDSSSKYHLLSHTSTVELHGYVSQQALTRLFQSQRNDEPLV